MKVVKCPVCETLETKVVDSRLSPTGDVTRRRRECPQCENRFTTYERVEEILPVVIKKDGRREPFLREKVFVGVQKSCQKRPVTTAQIEQLVQRVERKVQAMGLKEIPGRTLGDIVMAELVELDKVAYVRFASVYCDFSDIDEFVSELHLSTHADTKT